MAIIFSSLRLKELNTLMGRHTHTFMVCGHTSLFVVVVFFFTRFTKENYLLDFLLTSVDNMGSILEGKRMLLVGQIRVNSTEKPWATIFDILQVFRTWILTFSRAPSAPLPGNCHINFIWKVNEKT